MSSRFGRAHNVITYLEVAEQNPVIRGDGVRPAAPPPMSVQSVTQFLDEVKDGEVQGCILHIDAEDR